MSGDWPPRFPANENFSDPFEWRRSVLRETLQVFENAEPRDQFLRIARSNLAGWRSAARPPRSASELRVLPGDWGDVAGQLTREFGEMFAVLNMANAFTPGGGYLRGSGAQEENMFRRTDCHFSLGDSSIGDSDRKPASSRYRAEMTALLEGRGGRVYLDTETPRVCIRGPELAGDEYEGYAWLPEEEFFPFFELRAAAGDYRDGRPFDPADARRRICALLDTVVESGVQHAVLGAWGCGAFCNPAEEVAGIFRDEVASRAAHFECIAFAVYRAHYGPDNFEPFARILGGSAG